MKKALRTGFKLTDLKNLYLDKSIQRLKTRENLRINERKHMIEVKRLSKYTYLNNEKNVKILSKLLEISKNLISSQESSSIEFELLSLNDIIEEDLYVTKEIIDFLKIIMDKLFKISTQIVEVSLMELIISILKKILLFDTMILESFYVNKNYLDQIFYILHQYFQDDNIKYDIFNIMSITYENTKDEKKLNNMIEITLFYKKESTNAKMNIIFYSIFETYIFHETSLRIEIFEQILEILLKDLFNDNDPETNLLAFLVDIFKKCKSKEFLPYFPQIQFSQEIKSIISQFSSQKCHVVEISFHYYEILLLANCCFDFNMFFEEICKYLESNKDMIQIFIFNQLIEILLLLIKDNTKIESNILFNESNKFWSNILLLEEKLRDEKVKYQILDIINKTVIYYGVNFYEYSVDKDNCILLWLKRQLYTNDIVFLNSVLDEIDNLVINDKSSLLEFSIVLLSIKDKLEIIFYNSTFNLIRDICSILFKSIKTKYNL